MTEDSTAYPYHSTEPLGVEVWSTTPIDKIGPWDRWFTYMFLSWHSWSLVLWPRPWAKKKEKAA